MRGDVSKKYYGGVVAYLLISFVIFVVLAWPTNLYKLFNCDMVSDYKCEVVHGVGLVIPPLSLVTVWFGSDE